MRKEPLITGEFYHVYNRGVAKGKIVNSEKDYRRLRDTFFHYLAYSNKFTNYIPKESPVKKLYEYTNPKLVEIIAHNIMPNHFHLFLKQNVDGGISKYMQKVANSYTKYFNTKHERVGPLFQGKFKAKRVKSEEQFIYLTKYIHRNPIESNKFNVTVDDLVEYPWSSLPSYLLNRKDLLYKEPIFEIFKSVDSYRDFILDELDDDRIEEIESEIIA